MKFLRIDHVQILILKKRKKNNKMLMFLLYFRKLFNSLIFFACSVTDKTREKKVIE